MSTAADTYDTPPPVAGPPLTAVPEAERARSVTLYERAGKRAFDVGASAVLLVALAPVIGGVAVAVRASMGRGVFFRQARVGRNGECFEMTKFRSMNHDRRQRDTPVFDGPDRRETHKTDNDPRHTTLGRRLRKFRLDELPQLWHVLRGDMSLVGPRPELVSVAERHDLVEHPRTAVRPGMTGLWQVSDGRSQYIFENLDLDLDYVEQVTLRKDIAILARTAKVVVAGRGR